jgi:hypothetical protein
MSYSDPANPLPDLGPSQNPSRYSKSSAISLSTIVALVVAGVMVMGAVVYSMRDTTTSILPPATSGQGVAPINPPVGPPLAAPNTNDGVPPGVMAPPISATPPNLDSK